VLCRTREGVIATSFSADGGETWSGMEGIDLPNNNSGIEAVTLADGRHLLVYNHLGSGDHRLGTPRHAEPGRLERRPTVA
jgi:predicted neuraminidase